MSICEKCGSKSYCKGYLVYYDPQKERCSLWVEKRAEHHNYGIFAKDRCNCGKCPKDEYEVVKKKGYEKHPSTPRNFVAWLYLSPYEFDKKAYRNWADLFLTPDKKGKKYLTCGEQFYYEGHKTYWADCWEEIIEYDDGYNDLDAVPLLKDVYEEYDEKECREEKYKTHAWFDEYERVEREAEDEATNPYYYHPDWEWKREHREWVERLKTEKLTYRTLPVLPDVSWDKKTNYVCINCLKNGKGDHFLYEMLLDGEKIYRCKNCYYPENPQSTKDWGYYGEYIDEKVKLYSHKQEGDWHYSAEPSSKRGEESGATHGYNEKTDTWYEKGDSGIEGRTIESYGEAIDNYAPPSEGKRVKKTINELYGYGGLNGDFWGCFSEPSYKYEGSYPVFDCNGNEFITIPFWELYNDKTDTWYGIEIYQKGILLDVEQANEANLKMGSILHKIGLIPEYKPSYKLILEPATSLISISDTNLSKNLGYKYIKESFRDAEGKLIQTFKWEAPKETDRLNSSRIVGIELLKEEALSWKYNGILSKLRGFDNLFIVDESFDYINNAESRNKHYPFCVGYGDYTANTGFVVSDKSYHFTHKIGFTLGEILRAEEMNYEDIKPIKARCVGYEKYIKRNKRYKYAIREGILRTNFSRAEYLLKEEVFDSHKFYISFKGNFRKGVRKYVIQELQHYPQFFTDEKAVSNIWNQITTKLKERFEWNNGNIIVLPRPVNWINYKYTPNYKEIFEIFMFDLKLGEYMRQYKGTLKAEIMQLYWREHLTDGQIGEKFSLERSKITKIRKKALLELHKWQSL